MRNRCAFTLIELLVVIGIIVVLIAILLPALALAREAGNSAVCTSNLHQLFVASLNYANDNRNYWPPADLDFITVNNHRWHGVRPDPFSPFDFSQSELKIYLQAQAIKSCPSFVFLDASNAFERSCGGYGYNSNFLGSSLYLATDADWSNPPQIIDQKFSNIPAKMNAIRRPTEKLAFADAAIGDPALIEYSFLEPPVDSDGYPNSPSLHFRHRGSVNVSWADGHVTSQRMEWTYPGANVYGANNATLHLGYFGPHDDSLFNRD